MSVFNVFDLVAHGEYLEAERTLTDLREGRHVTVGGDGTTVSSSPRRQQQQRQQQQQQPTSFVWQALLDALLRHFVPAERSVAAHAFLKRGGRGTLESMLAALEDDLRGVVELSGRTYLVLELGLDRLERLCGDLSDHATLRSAQIRAYTAVLAPKRDLDDTQAQDVLVEITAAADRYRLGRASVAAAAAASSSGSTIAHTSMLGALAKGTYYELEALKALLRAHVALHAVDFRESMLWLYRGLRALEGWRQCFARAVAPDRVQAVGAGEPASYTMLLRVHTLLTGKATLYFHALVGRPLPPPAPAEERQGRRRSRTSPVLSDTLVGRLTSFQRLVSADFVCLVIAAVGTSYSSTGYAHPATPRDTLQGLRSYPIAFCAPMETVPAGSPLISIVTTLMENVRSLRGGDIVVFDEGEFHTNRGDERSVYYLRNVDERATLVYAFTYKGRRLERELDQATRAHLTEFAKLSWCCWGGGVA